MIVANSTVPLEALVVVLAPIVATAVVLTRNPLRQIVVNGVYGLVLSIAFFVFRAPDVALSMLVVSSVAYPLVILSAIVRVRNASDPDDGDDANDT